jgi:hypothetical protein
MATLAQPAVGNSVASNFIVTAAFGSNVTAGNLIFVVAFDLDNIAGVGTRTVTDNLGNTYTQIQAQQLSTQINWSCWYAVSIASGACTVTFEDHNGNTLLHGVSIVCAEFSGPSATAPLVSKNQFFQSSGGGGTGTLTLADSNGVNWTVSYTFLGGDTGYGVVDFTGAGADLLLFYNSTNSSPTNPNTTAPVTGPFNSLLAQAGSGFAFGITLWQFSGTIPFPVNRPRPYAYFIL